MGQISRMRRASAFQVEFNNDYIAGYPIKTGDKLTVKHVNLGPLEGSEEKIMVWLAVEDEKGQTHELTDGCCLFDPEDGYKQDTVEQLTNDLGITKRQAERRLKQQELFF